MSGSAVPIAGAQAGMTAFILMSDPIYFRIAWKTGPYGIGSQKITRYDDKKQYFSLSSAIGAI